MLAEFLADQGDWIQVMPGARACLFSLGEGPVSLPLRLEPLHFEALFCLAVGIASVAVHLYGFSWLYDGYALRPARRIALGLGLACAAWCATAVLLAGAFEPVSVATLVLLATFRLLVPKIHDEHQQLLSMRS